MSAQEQGPDSSRVPEHEPQQLRDRPIWYCPSRWLLAHNDSNADISTLSSHMCLADLNNEGESLLALIDFKKPIASTNDEEQYKSPYECRLRVYRGQQLIYNHFLEDIPSCLIATNLTAKVSASQRSAASRASAAGKRIQSQDHCQQQTLLTMAIMDDVYFYSRLRASHKFSLEDESVVVESLIKSEVEAWEMVKENKVDTEALRELLIGLSQELGNQELTSHSLNFLALESEDARKQYLLSWKIKKFQSENGQHIMSMDTVCCAAARLSYASNITRSGDFGQTRDNDAERSSWSRWISMQEPGLVLGTEDRHLLVYNTSSHRSHLESHYRLPAVPDHILVERRSVANCEYRTESQAFTYKILISCRNCRIYAVDQPYKDPDKSNPEKLIEIVALKCNVVEMSWCGVDETLPRSPDGFAESQQGLFIRLPNEPTRPLFVVACLDKKVYCFSSMTGQCKWVVDVELPITCLVCLPKLQIGLEESSLVGVGSAANRIDFYVGTSGRIVDSIYFGNEDYPTAATYGRFGREDNCLCLITQLGHLAIFILKRTAKFAHGQCLSSAASHASEALASCSQMLQQSMMGQDQLVSDDRAMKIDKPADVPSAFSLTKSSSATATDQILNSMLQQDHQCDQVAAKNALEAHINSSQLQIPVKGREFVDQILNQSRNSRRTAHSFALDMIKLRDKVKATMAQQFDMRAASGLSETGESNRVSLDQVTGLGNIYRVSLSLRLNTGSFVSRLKGITDDQLDSRWQVIVLVYPVANLYQVKPFRTTLPVANDSDDPSGVKAIFDGSVQFKLYRLTQAAASQVGLSNTTEVQLQIFCHHQCSSGEKLAREALFVTSINVPLD